MKRNLKSLIRSESAEFALLMRSIPATVVTLFVVSSLTSEIGIKNYESLLRIVVITRLGCTVRNEDERDRARSAGILISDTEHIGLACLKVSSQ